MAMTQPLRSSRACVALAVIGLLTSLGQAHSPAQIPLGKAAVALHEINPKIVDAIAKYADPVDAYVAVYPEAAGEFAERRLLHVGGEETAEWMTEGDKLRLRRKGKKFRDVTDHEEFMKQQVAIQSQPAHLPDFTEHTRIGALFRSVVPRNMEDNLRHFSSYYTRYYKSETGAQSARWLHDEIAKVIAGAPNGTHISLEQFTHKGFDQFSIIARFEPRVRDFSLPLTIVGAHQDSISMVSPLYPAPGADDDGSGTVTTLEVFRVLAESGFVPANGPVEFHWYAAEECGGCGSLEVARYKKESGATVGAMLQLDMTAFIASNSSEAVGVIGTGGDEGLTQWTADLAKEYSPIPAKFYELADNMGSDQSSFTKFGFPATLGSEGNPVVQGRYLGNLDPYIHTSNDTMDINDETGYFSIDHMARFAELALAFVVEQAKWQSS